MSGLTHPGWQAAVPRAGAVRWLAWRRLLVVLPRPSRRALRLVALGYVLKTVAFGVAWYLVPDLPQRVQGTVVAAWASLSALD